MITKKIDKYLNEDIKISGYKTINNDCCANCKWSEKYGNYKFGPEAMTCENLKNQIEEDGVYIEIPTKPNGWCPQYKRSKFK